MAVPFSHASMEAAEETSSSVDGMKRKRCAEGHGACMRTYNREREGAMGEGFRFVWNATRGHRFRPWRSPFLKWRLETFTGKHAENVGAKDFREFVWSERRQLVRFLKWLAEMRVYAGSGEPE